MTAQLTPNLPLNYPHKIQVSSGLKELLRGVWHDRLQSHAIILTYLATRNFQVIRFPTRPDRSVDGEDPGQREAVKLLDNYSDDELDALSEELAAVTMQTQSILKALYRQNQVRLQRAISPLEEHQHLYAVREIDKVEIYPLLAIASQKAGRTSISLDVDIVSGWSTSANQRYGSLHLARNWAIDDVLVVSDLLDGILESNEWLCINRNPRGLMHFPITDIQLLDLPPRIIAKLKKSGHVATLAEELQKEADQVSAERSIAYRPTPYWWKSELPLPKMTWREHLSVRWSWRTGRKRKSNS